MDCECINASMTQGTAEERGLTHWALLAGPAGGDDSGDDDADDDGAASDPNAHGRLRASDPRNDPEIKAVYDLPFGLQVKRTHLS